MKAGFLEGLLISVPCDSNSRHMTVPTRNVSNGATAQYLHLSSRTFFLLKRHVTVFIPSGKFTSSGSSQEGKQDFLDGGCTGWVESTTILDHHFVIGMALSLPPWALFRHSSRMSVPERQQLCLAVSDSWVEARQFC